MSAYSMQWAGRLREKEEISRKKIHRAGYLVVKQKKLTLAILIIIIISRKTEGPKIESQQCLKSGYKHHF